MKQYYRFPYSIHKAIADYKQLTGKQPQVMIVHPSRFTDAQENIQNLDMKVATSGGCLATELWLNIPEAGRQEASQLALFAEAAYGH